MLKNRKLRNGDKKHNKQWNVLKPFPVAIRTLYRHLREYNRNWSLRLFIHDDDNFHEMIFEIIIFKSKSFDFEKSTREISMKLCHSVGTVRKK